MSPEDHLLHNSVYVNLNYKVHSLSGKVPKLIKSSWDEYVGKGNNNFCKKDIVLDQFDNKKEYKKFAEELLVSIKKQREEEKELEELLVT